MKMQKTSVVPQAHAAADIGRDGHHRTVCAGRGAGARRNTSFPNYPLLTGGNSIPPNILLILDDSGSMEDTLMRADGSNKDKTDLDDNVPTVPTSTTRCITTRHDISAVAHIQRGFECAPRCCGLQGAASSFTSTTASKIDLRGTRGIVFLCAEIRRFNPGTTASNYDKYRITTSSSSNSYSGGVVQVKYDEHVNLINTTTIASIAKNAWSACISVSNAGYDSITIGTRSGGTGDGDLSVYEQAIVPAVNLLTRAAGVPIRRA